MALGRGSLDGHRVPVFIIEPHQTFTGVRGGRFGPADAGAFYRAILETGCYHVVRLVSLSSEQVTAAWSWPVALLWIDGDHRYEGAAISTAGVRTSCRGRASSSTLPTIRRSVPTG